MAVQITIRSGTAAALVQKAEQHQCATDDFKRTYKVCGEVRVRKSDLRETNDAQVRVDVLENAMGQKNQSHGKPNQQDTGRALRRSEAEMEQCVHVGPLTAFPQTKCPPVETCLSRHLDRHHHAFVFLPYDMAVKDKPPNNLRVCEGNDHFGLAGLPATTLADTVLRLYGARPLASLAVQSYR